MRFCKARAWIVNGVVSGECFTSCRTTSDGRRDKETASFQLRGLGSLRHKQLQIRKRKVLYVFGDERAFVGKRDRGDGRIGER